MKKPIGIELPKQTIDTLLNGASMIIVPIEDKNISIQLDEGEFIQSAYNFECDWCKGNDANCTDCYGLGRRWDIDCESKKEFVDKYYPLQKGDEFFIQEEFKYVGCKAENSPMSTYRRIAYSDHENYNDKGVATGKAKVIDASQMTQEQSRYKGIVVDVEVKRVQYLARIHLMKMKVPMYSAFSQETYLTMWLEKQGIKYEDNPYILLYTVKEIK